MFNVSQFLAQQKVLGHAKPNYFEVYLAAPSIADDLTNKAFSRIYCKAAQVPGVSLNYTEFGYQGMYVSLPTSRVYSDWTVTIVNDVNYILRTNLEKWVDEVSGNMGLPKSGGVSLGGLFSFRGGNTKKVNLNRVLKDMWIIQYSNAKIPRPTASYFVRDAFPTEVSPIDMAWDNNDSLEEYTTTFRYQYMERVPLTSLPGELVQSFTGTNPLENKFGGLLR